MMHVLVYPHRSKVDNPYLTDLTVESPDVRFRDWRPASALVESYDVFHVHWPESVWNERSVFWSVLRGLVFLLIVDWLRLRRTRVVLTVHNLQPHENDRPALNSFFSRRFDRRVDRVQVLAQSARNAITGRFRAGVSIDVVPMGSFVGGYPAVTDVRRRNRILHFGSIRRYKNTVALLRAVGASDTEWEVLVAGHCAEPTLMRELKAIADNDHRILLRLEKVPEAEVPFLHASSRLAVLPFTAIENSSTVMLALSLDVPVLAPRQGALPELQGSVGADWLRLYEGSFSTAVLDEAIAWAQEPRTGGPDLTEFSWDGVRSKLVASYRSAIDGSVGS